MIRLHLPSKRFRHIPAFGDNPVHTVPLALTTLARAWQGKGVLRMNSPRLSVPRYTVVP